MIEIVIKIPNDFYERVNKDGCMSYTDAEVVVDAFYLGKVLPKGHGDLVDMNAVLRRIEEPLTKAEFMIRMSAEKVLEADKEEADADSN